MPLLVRETFDILLETDESDRTSLDRDGAAIDRDLNNRPLGASARRVEVLTRP